MNHGIFTEEEVMNMNLGQVHKLKEELDLKWHSKIMKGELQKIILYLK